jgi:hypothetical protein
LQERKPGSESGQRSGGGEPRMGLLGPEARIRISITALAIKAGVLNMLKLGRIFVILE